MVRIAGLVLLVVFLFACGGELASTATPLPTLHPDDPFLVLYEEVRQEMIANGERIGPDKDCRDFANQREAQDFFYANGGPRHDPHNLDADGDGRACERWPRSS